MLSKPDVEVMYGENGVATGVKSEGQVAKSKFVVGDPGYFPGKVRLASKVVRAIAFLVGLGPQKVQSCLAVSGGWDLGTAYSFLHLITHEAAWLLLF
jgi:RAB protein geranylgeranyltransferase component A